MIMAKWLLFALLALPIAEIVTFIVVAAKIGFLSALALLVAISLLGALVLRHAGGHVARMRVVLGEGRLAAFEADGPQTMILIAGFLLLVPGFITGLIGLLLLIAPFRRWCGHIISRILTGGPQRADGVVDLEPQDWRHVPERQLPHEKPPEQR